MKLDGTNIVFIKRYKLVLVTNLWQKKYYFNDNNYWLDKKDFQTF